MINNNITKTDQKKDNILQNLINISKINVYDKIVIDGNDIRIDQRYFQYIRRWLSQDSRVSTINIIENIINESFDIIDEISSNTEDKKILKLSNSEKMHSFLNGLNGSINGLNNLKITYKNDSLIVTKIELIINKINIKIRKIQDILIIN